METIGHKFEKRDTLLIKGIAIMLMLFYHLFESADILQRLQVNYEPFSEDCFILLSGFGNICVALFAFLSAYGITRGLMARESEAEIQIVRFYYKDACKRYLKLVGNFVCVYLSANLLWFSYFDYQRLYGKGWQGFFQAMLDLTGLSQLFGTPTLNETWWYLKLAVLIIFTVPMIYMLVKKMGNYTVILAVLAPFILTIQQDVRRYIVVVVFGVVAAAMGWFEWISDHFDRKWYLYLAGLLLLVVSVIFRQNFLIRTNFQWLADAPIAFLICWLGVSLPGRIPGISHVLRFLGRHSMNIYMVHTFFYMSIYQPYIYQFRYAILIYIVLLAVTLVFSMVLEGIKTLCIRAVNKHKNERQKK